MINETLQAAVAGPRIRRRAETDGPRSVRGGAAQPGADRRTAERAPGPGASVAHQAKVLIESRYRESMSLTELAESVHVSPFHLVHAFTECFGVSPIQYLIRCRVEETKRLLRQTELPFCEIACRVGYENSSYFNRLFKKMVGVTPGGYRRGEG